MPSSRDTLLTFGMESNMLLKHRRALEALWWIENNTTLHNQVQIIYVVDGYEVSLIKDDVVIAGPWRGETVFSAIVKGMVENV
jgi:hypothetical protein